MRPERALALLLALAIAFAGPAAAKEKYKRAPELSASGRNNVMLAQSYLRTGKLADAEKAARAALLSDGDTALAHATMALVHAAKKQNDKAKSEFNRARAIAPNDGSVLNAYGSFLCATGDRAAADDAFRAAMEDRRTSPVQPLVNAGSCAMLGQEWVKAEGYLRNALKLAPTSRPVLLLMAELQLQLHKPFEARAFVERADALGPDARTLAMAARTEDTAGDAEAAAKYRKRLATEFPNYKPTAEGGRTQ